MATTEPRKPPTKQPLMEAFVTSLNRWKKRAILEGSDIVHRLCCEATREVNDAIDDKKKREKAAKLRAELGKLEREIDGDA